MQVTRKSRKAVKIWKTTTHFCKIKSVSLLCERTFTLYCISKPRSYLVWKRKMWLSYIEMEVPLIKVSLNCVAKKSLFCPNIQLRQQSHESHWFNHFDEFYHDIFSRYLYVTMRLIDEVKNYPNIAHNHWKMENFEASEELVFFRKLKIAEFWGCKMPPISRNRKSPNDNAKRVVIDLCQLDTTLPVWNVKAKYISKCILCLILSNTSQKTSSVD